VGKDLLKARMELAAEFWKAGIGTEFLHHTNPKPQKQVEYALEEGIPYIVWLGGNEIKEGVVKLKDLGGRNETVIKRTEITKHLKSILNIGQSSVTSQLPETSTALPSSSSADYERRAKEAEKRLQQLEGRITKLEKS